MMLIQKFSDLFHKILENMFGAQTLMSFFSFEGKIGRNQFFFVMVLIGLCRQTLFSNILLKYIAGLLLFYIVLATVQKRCRDFNSNGTVYVVLYSVVLFVFASNFFVTEHVFNRIVENIRIMMMLVASIISVIIFITLSYKISKPNSNMSLRSPLLKYPLLYTAVCWVLAICATLTVNHCAGVTIF